MSMHRGLPQGAQDDGVIKGNRVAKLSDDQFEFLRHHEISPSHVFDATGLTRARCAEVMSALGMVVAIGVSPCRKAGHTLRSRHGHCVMCGTHNLAFQNRFDESGEVYVAYSPKEALVKVGTSKYSRARMANLNSYGYGGASDWNIESIHICDKAGRVEFFAQSLLAPHRVSRTYWKTSSTVECNELFVCSVAVASAAVFAAITEHRQVDA